METILAAAFGRQVNVIQGEADDLTRAATDIFKMMQRGISKHAFKRKYFIALISEDFYHVFMYSVCTNAVAVCVGCSLQVNATHFSSGIISIIQTYFPTSPGYFPVLRKLQRKLKAKSALAHAYQKIVDTAYMLLEARRRMDNPPQVSYMYV